MGKKWKFKQNPAKRLSNRDLKKLDKFRLLDCLYALLLAFTFSHHMFFSEDHPDYSVYREAGRALVMNTDPYLVALKNNLGSELMYLYPPLLATIFAVFDRVSTLILDYFYLGLSSLALVYTAITIRNIGVLKNAPLFGITIALLLFPPITKCFVLGQINIIILGLFCLFLRSLKSNNSSVIGYSLALATMLKASPAILLLPLCIYGGAKAFKFFLAGMLVLFTITLFAPNGVSAWSNFLSRGMEIGSGGYASGHVCNYALSKFITSILQIDLISIGTWIARFVIGALIATFTFNHKRGVRGIELNVSAFIIIMLLASPILWFEHLVWALIPICIVWKEGRKSVVLKGLAAILMALLVSSIYVDTYFHLYFLKIETERFPILGPSLVVIPLALLLGTIYWLGYKPTFYNRLRISYCQQNNN